ncbi:hypothetical protein FRB98_005356, partial [Tulasnella sp. 332]
PIHFSQRWSGSDTQSVQLIAFSPDVRKIVFASADGTVRLWDVTTGALARKP